MADTTELAQLIATRLCHDLAGPIGAVAAGVELVGDDPASVDAETLGLIGASSAAAAHKLKFLRIAFGTPAFMSPAGLGELENVTRRYLDAVAGQSGAPLLAWMERAQLVQMQDSIGAGAIQLLFNLMVLTLEGMPKCAELAVSVDASPVQAHAMAVARAQQNATTAVRTDIVEAIANPEGVLPSARTAQALYAVTLAATLGAKIAMDHDGAELRTSVTLRPRS